MNAPFAPAIVSSPNLPIKALPRKTPIKIPLLSEDIMLQLTLRQMMEELPQKCVLESSLNRDEVAPFLDLAHPSLLLMDVCSVADPGSRSLRSLRIRHPSLPIVMISAQSVPEQIVRALRIGASGYLVTPLTSQHLVHCLRAANRGWPSLCQQAQESLVDWLLTSNQTCWNKFLSPREKH